MLAVTARGALQRVGLINLEWPDWAVDTFLALSVSCVALVGAQWLYDRRLSNSAGKGDNGGSQPSLAAGETAAVAAKFRR